MAKRFSETRDEFSTTCNPKSRLCQDACQHKLLHPYITASRTIVNIVLLKLNSDIGYYEACSQTCERGFVRYMPSPFYQASVVPIQLHGGMVSHMPVLATPSSTVHNTKYCCLLLRK